MYELASYMLLIFRLFAEVQSTTYDSRTTRNRNRQISSHSLEAVIAFYWSILLYLLVYVSVPYLVLVANFSHIYRTELSLLVF